jgi:hypothetical protein
VVTEVALGALPGDVDQDVRDWMARQMAAPDPRLGRPGPVCPHLPAALAKDLVLCCGRPWDPEESDPAAAVGALVVDAIEVFTSTVWPEAHPHLRAVVAVLTGMPGDLWSLLDSVHADLKPPAVARGLMLGQFHPASNGGAVHNADFLVLRSPYPLIVVRSMAPHDVLFLHHRPDLFRPYAQRFGHLYAEGRSPGRLPADLYWNAAARWGSSAQDTEQP